MSDTYKLRFEAEDALTPVLERIRAGLTGTSTDAKGSKGAFGEWSKAIGGLGKSIPGLAAKIDELGKAKGPQLAAAAFGKLDAAVDRVRQSVADLSDDIGTLRNRNVQLGELSNGFAGLHRMVHDAGGEVGRLHQSVNGLAQGVRPLASVKDAMVGLQRSGYGARMNVQELNEELLKAPGAVAGLRASTEGLSASGRAFRSLKGGAGGFNAEVGQSPAKVQSLSSGLMGLAARVAVFHGLKAALVDLGKAMGDVRDKTDRQGQANLGLRDQFRELANLQGKASPDNEVVAGALKFRVKTGLDNDQANEALRRFEGGIPFALAKGNIKGSSTEGTAGEFFTEAVRTATRVQVDAGTAGELASKIALMGKVPTADAGVSQFATIVDSYNRGSGDLTPLIQAGIRGAGKQVGDQSAFKTLPDYVAAHTVASSYDSPTAAATRVNQAARALNRFDDRAGLLSKGPGAGDTLNKLGIKAGDDFPTRIEKLAPLLNGKENADAALAEAGFKNSTERGAMLMFFKERQLLRDETATVRKGSDPTKVRADNAAFYRSDSAQERIAVAANEAADFAKGTETEKLVVARKQAESRLKGRREIDTQASAFDEAVADTWMVRAGASAVGKLTGKVNPNALPLSMGGKPTRDLKVDAEAFKGLKAEANRVGLNPDQFLDRRLPTDAPFEEKFSTLAGEVQNRGGNPFGNGSESVAALNLLISETRRTNELLQNQQKNQPPPFLPVGGPGGGF